MISQEFLNMLVCPETGSPLTLADSVLVDRINRAIQAGRVVRQSGQVVQKTLDGGLLRGDRTALYPILDGIPVLLADEAISLAQPAIADGADRP